MGSLSEPIKVESRIRQGCLFSPLAFILGLELTAHKMRSTPSINGINLPDFPNDENIGNVVLKLVMYADDVNLFLCDKADLENVLSLINDFSLFFCLKINKNKTEAKWLGSLKQCADTHFDLKLKRQLKILGI